MVAKMKYELSGEYPLDLLDRIQALYEMSTFVRNANTLFWLFPWRLSMS